MARNGAIAEALAAGRENEFRSVPFSVEGSGGGALFIRPNVSADGMPPKSQNQQPHCPRSFGPFFHAALKG